MTNEEAIKLLVNATYSDDWQGNEDLTTALDMAVNALKQEPCNDAISRQAVLDAIDDDNRNGHYSCFASNNDAQCFKGVIGELPPVTPQQKIGRWVDTESDEFEHHHVYQCSNCKQYELIEYPKYVSRFKYCPNCGAKMQEVE